MAIMLTPMNTDEFAHFRKRTLAQYAEGKVIAGEWAPDDAWVNARADLEKRLPLGLSTPHHHLLQVTCGGRSVGELWIAEEHIGPRAVLLILDIHIDASERRHGYARQALMAVESLARESGCEEVRLHVFGHNNAARQLYERLGYRIASLTLSKPLVPCARKAQ